MIEGAVKNVGDAHPEWRFTPYMARSISKRAAGTLTAQWPDVLAASLKLSEGIAGSFVNTQSPVVPYLGQGRPKGGRRTCLRRPPLFRLWKDLAKRVGAAKRSGKLERAETLIEVLKVIAKLQREDGMD